MKELKTDTYTHVLKYTGLFGGVQGLNMIVGLVRNKLIALLLGPEGMGLASLFNSSVNFISQATNLGISFSAVRHVSALFDSGDEEKINHFIQVVRSWAILTAVIGMLVCIVAGPLLSNYTFSWGDHTLHFVLLAPAVGLLAISGVEAAILKGARQLKALAVIQVYSVILALFISVPVYYFFGQAGIVPVIVLMALASMLLTIRYSYRIFPLKLGGTHGVLGEGLEMVKLGVAFVLAGIFGSGAEIVIRSFLNVHGDLDTVGLYNAGFMLTITYASLVFSSMETDYFPRLSVDGNDREKLCLTVNRQIEVSLLIISPMLALLMVFLPVLVPLLFSSKFILVIPMAQIAIFSMYLKAISLPIAYLTLAKGHSLAYLFLELGYSVVLVILIILGYTLWQLWGTGLALTVSYVFDFVLVYCYAHLRYGYRLSSQVLLYAALQLPLGIAVYLVTFVDNPFIYWGTELLLCSLSMFISLYILHRKTSLWDALGRKVRTKFGL